MQCCQQAHNVYQRGFAHGLVLGYGCSSRQDAEDECECFSYPKSYNDTDTVSFVKKFIPIYVSSITECKSYIKELLSEIDEYYDLPEGWDNESEEKTNSVCLDLAKKFVHLLRPTHKMPDFSAATGEEVALYWQEENFYFIIHFFQDNSLRYFVQTDNLQASGKILFFSDFIPQEIEIYIFKK